MESAASVESLGEGDGEGNPCDDGIGILGIDAPDVTSMYSSSTCSYEYGVLQTWQRGVTSVDGSKSLVCRPNSAGRRDSPDSSGDDTHGLGAKYPSSATCWPW